MNRGFLTRLGTLAVVAGLGAFTSESAHAANWLGSKFNITGGADISEVALNIVTSSQFLPGLITGISYMLALLFGVTGILKLKEHVENPSQVAVRVPIIRFLIGGGLLALPIIYEAMTWAINGGTVTNFEAGVFSATNSYSSILGHISGFIGHAVGADINYVLGAITTSLENIPALIAAAAYLLGLLFGVIGLLKLKAHVENPDQVAMKESVVRLLIGGALFALPTVYQAMQVAITGTETGALSTVGKIANFITQLNTLMTGAAECNPVAGFLAKGGGSLGDLMCSIHVHVGAFPAFLTAMSYIFGLVLGFWGILKVQDHVLNPQQTNIWEGLSKFIAAGCFFALPAVLEIMKNTVAPMTVSSAVGSVFNILSNIGGVLSGTLSALHTFGCSLIPGLPCPPAPTGPSCAGLDGALQCFVSDISGPVAVVLSLFTAIGGTILIMIGISRLTKSAQEGARGPGGIGTIMTFLCGGLLLSYNEILSAFGTTIFGTAAGRANPDLVYDTGMTAGDIAHAQVVIVSVLQFMTIVGLISFVRGIFIIRSVAEGNGQASIMAGVTHMVGGALAVNLGPLMNAVQTSLGITGYGINFT